MRLNFVEGWKIVLHDSSYLWRACLHFLPGVEHWPLLPKCNYCNPLSPNLLISLVLLCLVEDDNALHKDQSAKFNFNLFLFNCLQFGCYLAFYFTILQVSLIYVNPLRILYATFYSIPSSILISFCCPYWKISCIH